MSGVLILDANQRSALAATRSLGRRGIRVVVADETRTSLAGASRFAAGHVRYPSPYTQPAAFVSSVREIAEREESDVVLPMTDVTTALVIRHRARLGGLRAALPPLEGFEALSDKWVLSQRGVALGISTPATHLVTDLRDAERFAAEVGYPIVVKPRRSRLEVDGRWIQEPVEYAESSEELRAILARRRDPMAGTTLLQAFVHGRGQGVFALYREGRPAAFFAHRRLRERPPTGGVSVLSESVPVDPTLRAAADRLLTEARWHGVAMVEFKVTEQGNPVLIEINGRFWGSLQLAIDAGVDFPYLVYELALSDAVEPVNAYTVGIRSRWLLGDLDQLYLRLARPRLYGPRSPRAVMQAVLEILAGGSARGDVNRWDDLGPFLHEVRAYVGGVFH